MQGLRRRHPLVGKIRGKKFSSRLKHYAGIKIWDLEQRPGRELGKNSVFESRIPRSCYAGRRYISG